MNQRVCLGNEKVWRFFDGDLELSIFLLLPSAQKKKKILCVYKCDVPYNIYKSKVWKIDGKNQSHLLSLTYNPRFFSPSFFCVYER